MFQGILNRDDLVVSIPSMSSDFHPWLSSPESLYAAQTATRIPRTLLPDLTRRITIDALETQALRILTECALPPGTPLAVRCLRCGGSLGNARVGARFCTRDCRDMFARAVTPVHAGSMWTWPEGDMARSAAREIGYALNDWLRSSL